MPKLVLKPFTAEESGEFFPYRHLQESGPMKTFTVHCEYPVVYRTYVTAIAEGADVDPWRLVHDGGDTSVLPVPLLFSEVPMVAGYAAAKSDYLADQLRIMVDAIGADGGLRITPEAMVRLRATGQAILDDITAFGLSPTPNAAPSVVPGSPNAT